MMWDYILMFFVCVSVVGGMRQARITSWKNDNITGEAIDGDHFLFEVLDFRLLNKSVMYNNFEHFKCSKTTLLSKVLCPISWFTCGIVVNLGYIEPLLNRQGRSFTLKSHIYVIIMSANARKKK